jgi:hypothetical protein
MSDSLLITVTISCPRCGNTVPVHIHKSDTPDVKYDFRVVGHTVGGAACFAEHWTDKETGVFVNRVMKAWGATS